MRKKILVLSVYPAPYRVELIQMLSEKFDLLTFFENGQGDQRDESWFIKGNYYLLNTDEGIREYQKASSNLKHFDLVLFYDYSTPNSVKLITKCRLCGIPYFINADGVMLTAHGNFLREMVKRIAISGAKGCFASGQKAKEYFQHYGAKPERVHLHTFSTLHRKDILSTPLDTLEKEKLREQLGLQVDSKIAIAVGRFIPLKMYDRLISAWKEMPSDCHLLLIGGGEEEEHYRQIIKSNHLQNVKIEQFHPYDQLMLYYKACDVFVHPTSYDVWGLVVNEAMACGLPVVVSDKCVAGLELVRQGENGFLFPYTDDTKMISYIKEVLESEERYHLMALNALKTIHAYTIENMADCQIKALTGSIE